MNSSVSNAPNIETKRPNTVLAAVSLSMVVLLSPLYWNHARWIVIFGLLAILPQVRIVARVIRRPNDRAGYSLAMGVSALMNAIGLLLLVVQLEQHHRDVWSLLFTGGLLITNGVLLVSSIVRYQKANSLKPHWRLLLGSLAGTSAYYLVLFVLASGAVVRAHR